MIYDDVIEEMNRVHVDKGLGELSIERSTLLSNIGFDSLMFAILITRLEDKLAMDPFQQGDDMLFPVTVGELVGLYETLAGRAGEDLVRPSLSDLRIDS